MTLAGYIGAANMAQQVGATTSSAWSRPGGWWSSRRYCRSIRHPQLILRFAAFLRREAEAVQALKDKYGLWLDHRWSRRDS